MGAGGNADGSDGLSAPIEDGGRQRAFVFRQLLKQHTVPPLPGPRQLLSDLHQVGLGLRRELAQVAVLEDLLHLPFRQIGQDRPPHGRAVHGVGVSHGNEQLHGALAADADEVDHIHPAGHAHVAVDVVFVGHLLQLRIGMAIERVILQCRAGQGHHFISQGIAAGLLVPHQKTPIQHGVQMAGYGADIHMQLRGDVRGTLGGRSLIEAGEYRKGLADTLGIRRNFLVVLSRLRHSQHPFLQTACLFSLLQ